MLAPERVVEPSNCLRRARSEMIPAVVAGTSYMCQWRNTPSRGGRSYSTSPRSWRFSREEGTAVRERIVFVLPLFSSSTHTGHTRNTRDKKRRSSPPMQAYGTHDKTDMI